jgi:hypothetical protein
MAYKGLLLIIWLSFLMCNGGSDDTPSSTTVPLKLLVPNEGHASLVPHKSGFDFLRSLDSRPVSVVTLIGRARSGKSYSLNRILNAPNAFPVGHTLFPKTKGVDIYGKAIPSASGKVDVVFLDTEGLGASPSSYDKAVLLFSVLISSHIVYHLSEYIYLEDVSRLYSIANLVKLYEKRHLDQVVSIPELTWMVQRYTLEQSTESATDPLYSRFLAEQENPDDIPTIAEFNETVSAVKRHFVTQNAFFIPPAVVASSQFNNLTNIPVKDLDSRYLTIMDAVRDKLLSSEPKRLDRKTCSPMTGRDLAEFAMSILPAVNEGGSILGDVVLNEVSKGILSVCKSLYVTAVNSGHPLPIDDRVLAIKHKYAKEEAVACFERDMIGDSRSYKRGLYAVQLSDEIDDLYAQLRNTNVMRSVELCDRIADYSVMFVKQYDYGGNRWLYDHHAKLVMENATISMRGPRTTDCLKRIQRELDVYKNAVIMESMPKRIWSAVRNSFFVFVFSLIVPRVTKNTAAVYCAYGTTALSFAAMVFTIWALDGSIASKWFEVIGWAIG